ncbi:MAG TPA: M1 family aminopeptidase [Clostridia bacterium]|nr:M1 family aminopeptidase [Clostridia bacterium]
MQKARRPLGRALLALFVVLAGFTLALHIRAAEKTRIQVDDYVIDATLQPATHRLTARARVKFTALDDISVATFELHNALRPTRVLDAEGHTLSAERVTQDSTVRVALPAGMSKGQTTTLTFDYEGVLLHAEDSPVQGLKLASVGDPISYLLYAGRWFPMVGYGTNRFTSVINITVPVGYTVVGSGKESTGAAALPVSSTAAVAEEASQDRNAPPVLARRAGQKAPAAKAPAKTKARTPKSAARSKASAKPAEPVRRPNANERTFTFTWDRPSFPGTIIAGKFEDTPINQGGLNVHVYFLPEHKNIAAEYGETAAKEFGYFTTLYGVPMSTTLKVVELPDDTVPSAWAPEIAAIASRALGNRLNYRLLANTVAHQWWGVSVSPATRNDWWLADGTARYSETRYIDQAAGQAGAEEAVKDMAVGALAYETVPLSQVGTLDPFDPVFQSLVTDKGGMVFHMLRWVLGDTAYDKTMRSFAQQFAGKPASVEDFRQIAEQASGEQLTWFFSQWLDSTGAPEFKNKYTIYRVPKGFRVVGEISQDLDLFRMPVELKIDTDGQTETKRIEVVGTNSSYAVETFGKPRRITIDPNSRVLKNSPDLRLRTAIMRGQQLIQQGNLAESLREFQKALEVNKNSSLAHYRIAEVFYMQRNYQAAANSYRESLNGDGEPRWTEVWSHIQLGKIFDVTGQRERAVNEYRQALQTNDDTQGALEEARKYMQAPFQRETNKDASGS